MLGKRILTAVIGSIIAIYVINYGEWLFAATILILAILAWHEFYTLLKNKSISVFYSLGILANILIVACAWLGNSQELMVILFASTLLALLRIVISASTITIIDVAFTALGISYIGMAFAHLVLLRFTDQFLYLVTPWGSISAGAAYLWLAFIGTWASDTFAFFIGSYLGKHKLCPAISPNKTIEGAVGGMVGSVIAITLLTTIFKLPVHHGIIMGILVGLAAPAGDLVESAIKRFAGVKDSGQVLPGHGGILDRFDSILFTVPVIYYYIHAFILC